MGLGFISVNERLIETIKTAIPDAAVFILDPRCDGVHLEAVVISDSFRDKKLLEQHRMVMKPLDSLFAAGLHALGVKTFTRESWKKNCHRFPTLEKEEI